MSPPSRRARPVVAVLAGSTGLVAVLGLAVIAFVLMYVFGTALRIAAVVGICALVVAIPVVVLRRVVRRSQSRESD